MAIKNISDLNSQANILLPDNSQQLISPSDVRTSIKDLIDSSVNRLTDKVYMSLRVYDSSRSYETGEGCFYGGVIYEAISNTTGAFNPSAWTARSSANGTWGSVAGDISNQSDLVSALASKQNTISANLPLFTSGSVLNIQLASSSQNGYLSQSDWIAFNGKENPLTLNSPLVREGNTVSIQYASDTQDGIVTASDWLAISGGFLEIAYPDALGLVTTTSLQKGKYYKLSTGTRINENNGTSGNIILQALDINNFSAAGYLESRVAKYQEIGASIAGVWLEDSAPEVNENFIFNGKVYKNLTGVNATNPDSDEVNWELQDVSGALYKTEIDFILYDFVNDWIYYREDKRGNKYSFSRFNDSSVNGIDTFQWGNDLCFGNVIDNGVLNNINNPVPVKLINLTKLGIYKSLATTENRTYTFPDVDGTVALLSDIGTAAFVTITHADLLEVIEAEELIVGGHYLISDFKTIHVVPGTSVLNTATIEPLICIATSLSTLDSRVYSALNPFDTIIYDINNIVAEDTTTARPGKIIYRKDNKNNLETWYDFRAVKFRRYQIDGTGMATWAFSTSYTKGQVVLYSGIIYKSLSAHIAGTDFYTDLNNYKWVPISSTSSDYIAWATSIADFGGTITANSSLFQDKLTFASGCENISIGKNGLQPYNNIVFLEATKGYSIDLDCKNMSIYGNSNSNTIGKGCSGVLLFGAALSNTIGDNSSGIIISNSSANNNLKDTTKQIFISGSSSNNTFDTGCENMFLNGGCSFNNFKKNSKYNFLSSGAEENIIGAFSEGNILSGSSKGNIVGSDTSNYLGANNNVFTNSVYANVLADGCSGNIFNNSANNNRLGAGCTGNNFNYGSYNNLLDNSCNYNTFTNSSSYNKLGSGSGNNYFSTAAYNSIGQYSSNNTFSSYSNGNSIGNRSDYNAFGNYSVGNRIGNYCLGNQVLPSMAYYFGASGQHNVFENYCSNNVINGNYNRLESYCNFIQCITTSVYLSNCFFCSGVQNIAFNGTFIVDNLRILQARSFASLITVSSSTAPKYNNIVVDMKDAWGNLWYKTISLTGKISTKKFV